MAGSQNPTSQGTLGTGNKLHPMRVTLRGKKENILQPKAIESGREGIHSTPHHEKNCHHVLIFERL